MLSPDRWGELTALALLLPMALAALCGWPPARKAATAIAPWAALPALILTAAPVYTVDVPRVFLDMRLGVDPIGRVYLLFTSVLWMTAGWFARYYMPNDPRVARFIGFYLLAMTGNFGLILAQDIATFYLFFAMMSFSAYVLVIHDGEERSRRAGRIYLGMAIGGEVMQFAALSMLAFAARDLALSGMPSVVATHPLRSWIVALLLIGYGVKAGAILLHVWLPLAHPVAPTPASAVLSGAMIKAGLLGWLRFLPLGLVALPDFGAVVVVAGLAAVFYAAGVGLTQSNPKTILAYSSVSQMGLMIVALGLALTAPDAWPVALPAILIYAAHHALAKSALFLGVGMASSAPRGRFGSALLALGVALPALALTGAPLTAGAAAKIILKKTAAFASVHWSGWIDMLLSVGAIATTLLMGRFAFRLVKSTNAHGHNHSAHAAIWLPWLALVAAGPALIWWLLPAVSDLDWWLVHRSAYHLFVTTWPLVTGALIAATAWVLFARRARPLVREIPAGDLVVLMEKIFKELCDGVAFVMQVLRGSARHDAALLRFVRTEFSGLLAAVLTSCEEKARRWPVVGGAFLVTGLILLLLTRGQP